MANPTLPFEVSSLRSGFDIGVLPRVLPRADCLRMGEVRKVSEKHAAQAERDSGGEPNQRSGSRNKMLGGYLLLACKVAQESENRHDRTTICQQRRFDCRLASFNSSIVKLNAAGVFDFVLTKSV